ncbi:MAG: tRNA preQ1(34) S-adenosylmethionine ribosyltransferase-isomerase QueA [Deltaproteobacteria bacterium]|nr:tRNA preQ1(34) S-adenosylmethionine ribosyltransferase-isomerase QueA [Deltaproteobacteria bacterium]
MKTDLFNYHLPSSLIAQHPEEKRDNCKLLIYNRKTKQITHGIFKDITDYISPGDLLILNDTKVIPARLFGKKKTGGRVEIFLVEKIAPNIYKALTRGKLKQKTTVTLKNGIQAHINKEGEKSIVSLDYKGDFDEILDEIGEVPLPPYIKRNYQVYNKMKDMSYYQTIFAKKKGAIAAPTAGLHFTHNLLSRIREKGVNIAYITLHVGIGTFKPVKEEDFEKHKMDPEYFEIGEETEKLFNETKKRGGKVFACGTTTVRALESNTTEEGFLKSGKGFTNLFIYPGYKFKAIDALITNFHLPKSTLLLLVSAFAGREEILHCYEEAIKKKYKFYSFGDAMLIL